MEQTTTRTKQNDMFAGSNKEAFLTVLAESKTKNLEVSLFVCLVGGQGGGRKGRGREYLDSRLDWV